MQNLGICCVVTGPNELMGRWTTDSGGFLRWTEICEIGMLQGFLCRDSLDRITFQQVLEIKETRLLKQSCNYS